MFIREGSLKAWKIEQDKIKSEEEEKERVKSAKRSKSPKSKVGHLLISIILMRII
jgi:hypothetical protein